jgi:hypothetical protein
LELPESSIKPQAIDNMRHRFRLSYTYKLLAGFGVSIALLLAIMYMADHTMVRLSDSVRSTVAHQLEDLTLINKLQAESVSIRLAEIQLPRFSDVWAISSAVDELSLLVHRFDGNLKDFSANCLKQGDKDTERLYRSWQLYSKELKKTIRLPTIRNRRKRKNIAHSLHGPGSRISPTVSSSVPF